MTAGPRAVVFAYHAFGTVGLAALERSGITVARVFSHADPGDERIWWPPVAGWCAARGIPCELDADLALPDTLARVAADAPDLLFSFYYRRMIPGAMLDLAPRGAFNLHGSLLPRYRGRAPVNWQLVHGERTSGLTLHRMLPRADAGCIIAQQAVRVHPDQDAMGLTRQLLAIAPGLLDDVLGRLVAGTAVEVAQDDALATRFGGRRPEDGRIDWRLPAREVHDLVRAVAPPWPGASTWFEGRPLIVWRTAVLGERSRYGEPGTMLGDGSVACGSGSVALLAWGREDETPVALPAGSRLMAFPSETSNPA